MITDHDYDGDDDCDGGHGLPAPTHHLQFDKRAFICQDVVDHPKILKFILMPVVMLK